MIVDPAPEKLSRIAGDGAVGDYYVSFIRHSTYSTASACRVHTDITVGDY
ncbi:hypothetical protein ES703_116857 [subsurface metagenome]